MMNRRKAERPNQAPELACQESRPDVLGLARELAWQQALSEALRLRRKTIADLAGARKSAPWKVALAAQLKQTTQARNAWLAEHLHMGRAEAVSSHVTKLRRNAS